MYVISYCSFDLSVFQKVTQLAPAKPRLVTYSRATSQKSILCTAVKRKSGTKSQEPPEKVARPAALKEFAVLPGIGHYANRSSDSDASSDEVSSDENPSKIDLTGRQIKKKKDHDE